MTAPDIFFAHSGHHRYFLETVRAAAQFGRVNVLDLDASPRSECYEQFRSHYVHLSNKPLEYEFWCFKRFFLLLDYFERNRSEQGWLLDSDFLLVDFLPNPASFPKGTDCGLSFGPSVHPLVIGASPHCSFWTLSALRDFCEFLAHSYASEREKLVDFFRRRQEQGVRGGISDMTLIGFWMESRPPVLNFYDFVEHGLIDHNMRVLEQPMGVLLKSRFQMKMLIPGADGLYVETLDEQQRIKVCGLHFQGKAKTLIRDLAAGNKALFTIKAAARSLSMSFRRTSIRLRQRSQERHSRDPG